MELYILISRASISQFESKGETDFQIIHLVSIFPYGEVPRKGRSFLFMNKLKIQNCISAFVALKQERGARRIHTTLSSPGLLSVVITPVCVLKILTGQNFTGALKIISIMNLSAIVDLIRKLSCSYFII